MNTNLVLVACLLLLTLGQAKPRPDSEPLPAVCKAGERYEIGCKSCMCGDDGKFQCYFGCCYYDGEVYIVGEKIDIFGDCKDCTCGEDGLVACAEKRCAPCRYAGPDGSTKKAESLEEFTDGCNECFCINGQSFCNGLFWHNMCLTVNAEGYIGWVNFGTKIIGVSGVCTCKISSSGYSGMECE